MKRRKLGHSNLGVAPLALGGNVFGWTADEPTSFRLLDAFVDAGLNFIDTADMYSRWAPGHQGGESETLIGRWLKQSGKRDRVVLATKAGMEMGLGKKGLSKKYLNVALEDSLRRLQVDHIDLYQSHQEDPKTPLEETLEAYGAMIKQGKVRAIGASNFSPAHLTEALRLSRDRGLPRYESLQPHYNLYHREDYERNLEPLCREAGLGVITYFSLASGFLTGKYRSEKDLGKSPRGQGMGQFFNERGLRILAALDEVAREKQATPAQISLAWLIARPSVTAPIASATSLTQLEDLIAAVKLELDVGSIQQLEEASRY